MKHDLRTIKTRLAIENAFIELVEQNGFEKVKIIDIAKKAMVNRNTIYLHYDSKEEIIQSIVDRAFSDEISKININFFIKGRASKKNISLLMHSVFTAINDHIDTFRLVMIDQNMYGYAARLNKNIQNYFDPIIQKTKNNEAVLGYIINGVQSVIERYIVYDFGTIDENVEILTKLIVQNAKYLDYK